MDLCESMFLHVCMCQDMYALMRPYVCALACVHACTCVRAWLCMCTRFGTPILFADLYVCVCVSVRVGLSVCGSM